MAAKQSDKHKINNEIVAIFTSNNIAVTEEPIKTHDAPERELYSIGLVTYSNKLRYRRLRYILYLL